MAGAGTVLVTPFGTPAALSGTNRTTSSPVTGIWGSGQNRVAGNLLVAVVTAGATTSVTAVPAPSGWSAETSAGNSATINAAVAIFTRIATGADAAPVFTSTLTGTGAMTCTLFELGGAGKPADATGTYASGASAGALTSMTVTTTSVVTNPGEYAIAGFAQEAAAATNTWNPGTTSWVNAVNDGATSSVLHSAVDVLAAPASGAVLAETGGHWTTNATAFGAAAMIVVVPLLGAVEVFANNPSTTITAGGATAPAAGTIEIWTAASSTGFPAVTVKGAAQFHIADPAILPREMITVLHVAGTAWTVVRGAENTVPVAHASGFTVVQVVTAGMLGNGQQVFSVRDFGALGDATTDDTAAIQTCINTAASAINNINGGYVYFPPGAYYITAPLSVPALVSIVGAGRGPYAGNICPVTIYQSNTAANGINLVASGSTLGSGVTGVTLQGFTLAGPVTGTGKGIYMTGTAIENLRISDVTVDSFGGNGIELQVPFVSRLDTVVSQNNGGEGFFITGLAAGGTSCTFTSCWANSNALTGWHLYNMGYCSLVSCAADSNGRAYYIDTCTGIGLYSCGAETNVAKNSLDGSVFVVTGSTGVVSVACMCFSNAAKAFWVTGSSTSVSIIGFIEASPAGGATASIQVDSGSHAVLVGTGCVTAMSLAAGGSDALNWDRAGGLRIAEGAGASRQGTVTMNGTTSVTVSTTSVTANSRIFLTINTAAGSGPGVPYVVSRVAATSFTVKSTVAGDTSAVAWMISEPG